METTTKTHRRTARRRHFKVEQMEPRVLLSASPGIDPATLAAAQMTVALPAAGLSGVAGPGVQPQVQAAVNWVGTGSGDWDVAANWSTNAIPGPNDNVVITQTGITITVEAGDQAAQSLMSAAAITVAGGSLTLGSDSQISGTLTVDGTTGSSLTTNGTLTVSGATLLENGASVTGTGALANTGALTATGGTNAISAGYNDSGTTEVTSGTLSLSGGATSSGIWTADSGTTITLSGTGNGYAFNPGAQWNGTGLFSIGHFNYTLSGYAPVLIASGLTLSPLNLQMTNDGNLELDGTLTIPANGTFTAGAVEDALMQISGTGTINISQGGTMQIGNGQGWLGFSGPTLNNHGTLAFDADSALTTLTFDMESNATIFNFAEMEIQNHGGTAATSLSIGGFGFLNNFGTVDMDADAPLTMQLQVNNDGTFNVSNGSVTIANDGHAAGSSFGAFNVSADSTLTFSASQSLSLAASFNGAGTYALTFGATLTLSGATVGISPANFVLDGGVINGPGTFTVTTGSTFAWNGGTIGNFEVQSGVTINAAEVGINQLEINGGTLSNDGTINFTSMVTFADSAVLQNQADGQIQIQIPGSGDFLDQDDTSTLDNAGTITVLADTTSPSDSTTFFLNTFSNTGTLNVETGVVKILGSPAQISTDGTTLTGGTWMVGAGASLTIFGIESGSTTTVTTNEATVILEGAGASFNALDNLTTNSGEIDLGPGASATLPGNFTQTSTGSLTVQIAGSPASAMFGSLNVTGTANLGGTLDVLLDNNYLPLPGAAYPIVTYGTEAGDFATLENVAPTFAGSAGSTGYLLTVQGTAFPDLSVGNIGGDTSAISGANMTVTYTVTNGGSADAVGSWTDSIYISPGNTFDPTTAVLLGSVTHSGGLAMGSSYNGSITAPAPGVSPGNYSVIVVTDSQDQLPDENRTNNEAAGATPVAFSAPQLTVGTPINGTIANGGAQLYELDLAGNSQVQLSLQTALAAGAQIYVKYGAAPTSASFDETAFNVTGTTDSITLNAAQPGPYYVLVTGRESSGSGASFTLAAQEGSFGITSLTPTSGTGSTTITIQGSQFSAADTVSLIPSAGGAALTATNAYFTDGSTIAATFDLTGVPSGTAYDVQVSDGTNTVTAPAAFTAGTAVQVQQPILVTITAPAFVRAGLDYTIQVNYENVSDEDQPAPLLTITSVNGLLKRPQDVIFGPGVPESLGTQTAQPKGTIPTVGTIAFLATNTSGGPAGILPAGYQGSATVDVGQTVDASGTVMTYGVAMADPTKTMNYAALAPYVDSATYTASEWTALWSQVQTTLGTTQAGYLAALSNAATLMPADDGDNTDVIDDMQIVLNQAQAAVTTSISGKVTTSSPGLQLGGLSLDAVNSDTGDSFGTVILNDGSFVLPNITPGDYTFSIEGAIEGAAAPVTVAMGQAVTGVTLTATSGATLLGTTTNTADGSILAGASIKLLGANGESFSTTSNANGQYQVAGIPADTYTIIATATGAAQLVDENVAISSTGQVLNLSLGPEATITGNIAAAPSGSTIIAQPAGNTDPNLEFVATPDLSGDFTLSNLPAGTYDLTISSDGSVTSVISNVTVPAAGTQSVGSINLTAVATISGGVTSSDPNAPANAVTIGAYQNGTLIASAATDTNGNYSIAGLAPGTYQLEPVSYPYFSNDPSITVAAGQAATGVDVQLQPGGVISGTVTNESNAQPLANLAVYATDSSGNMLIAYTDANGNYAFQHLALGTYNVVSALETASQSVNATVTTLNPTPVPASFQPSVSESISGQLLLSDGATPPANGEVALLQNGQVVATASSDTNGNYSFLLQQTGTFTIEAYASNASFNPVPNVTVNAGQNVTQNFSAGSGVINLTATDSTESVIGDTVDVIQASTNLEIAYAALTGSGQISLPNLVDGDYQIVIAGNNDGYERGAVTTVTITGGATVTTAIALQTQAILAGTITDTNTGNPISNAYIGAYSKSDPNLEFFTPANANGTYSLPNVPFGTYDLVAFADGYAASIQQNVTINGGNDVFNFALSSSGSTALTGQIVDQNNNPVTGARVAVLNASNEIIGLGLTGANGRFQITSATGPNLILRISTPQGLTLQTAETGPDPDTVMDVGTVDFFSASFGLDNLFAGLSAALGSASQNIGNSIQTLSNLANPIGPLINELDNFNAVRLSTPTPTSNPCPTTDASFGAYAAAVAAEQDAYVTVIRSQFKAVADARQFTGAYTVEFLTNFGFALQAAGAVLAFSPQVLSAMADAPLFGPPVPGQVVFQALSGLLGLAQSMVGLVTDLGTLLFKPLNGATAESDVAAAESAGALTLASAVNNAVGSVSALDGALRTAFSKPGPNGLIGPFSQVLGLVSSLANGLDALQFNGSANAVTTLQTSLTTFIGDRQKYYDAYDAAVKAANAYNSSMSNSSGGCGPHGQGGGATISLGPRPNGGNTTALSGHDPNDLFGPAGSGPQNFIAATQPLGYRIDFENDPDASASTAVVTITETLDANLDLSTFQLGEIGFGGISIDVPAGLTSYQTVVDDTQATGLDVRVNASLDVQTRVVTWTFTSLDPTTGQPPANPLAGFLPPDVTAPEGLGFVTYTIQANAGLPTGTTVSAQASVVFDENAAIATPAYTNTLDAAAPTASIKALPAQEAPDFTVQWSAMDDAGGSGVYDYNVYSSVNGGAFQPLLLGTMQTAVDFMGTVGDTYSFYVTASDNVGNDEVYAPVAEVTTQIVTPQTFTVTAKKVFTFLDATGQKVTVKLSGPGSAVGTLEGGVASGADLRSLVLDDTTAKTSVSVSVAKGGSTQIAEILTGGTDQALGSLVLGAKVILGDGLGDGTTALDLSGSVNSLSLGEIAASDQIEIGGDLTGAAASAEKPALSSGAILGAGVSIGATGGLGAVKMASWDYTGSLTASLGIASLTVSGPLLADLTAASMGNLTAGSISGSTITIEDAGLGNVTAKGGSIENVTITAASGGIGNISASPAGQAGTVMAIDALTVSADSIGNITAAVPAFASTNSAAGIAASSFTATSGNIGAVKTSVAGAPRLSEAEAIDGSTFTSETGAIGAITAVVTSASPTAVLAGIRASDFTAKTSIGKITATAVSNSAHPTSGTTAGIEATTASVDFSAGTSIGAITVTAGGADVSNIALSASQADRIQFSAGASIGTVSVTAAPGKAKGTTTYALSHVDLTAGGAIGKILIGGDADATQALDFQVYAGGSIAGIGITSKNQSFGSISDSTILAGQLQGIVKSTDLAKAGIGFVTISGSFSDDENGQSTIGAQGNIGAVKIGGGFENARIVAGINAGADHLAYTSDDSYNDAAGIASVSVGGAFSDSSIIAGVSPGADFVFGTGVDPTGTAIAGLKTGKIGAITLGAATLSVPGSTVFRSPAAADQTSAIEAVGLTSIKIGKLPVFKDFTAPVWIDANGDGIEQSTETLIRVVS